MTYRRLPGEPGLAAQEPVAPLGAKTILEARQQLGEMSGGESRVLVSAVQSLLKVSRGKTKTNRAPENLSSSHPSDVVKERHETEIHVELLMAVKERETRVVGREIDFGLLIAAEHEHVFHHAGSRLPGNPGKFKSVAVKMNRMNVITCIAKAKAVALTLVKVK